MKKLWLVLVIIAAAVVGFSFFAPQATPVATKITIPDPVVKDDPVTSPSIVTMPQNGKEQGFTIQVYSFRDPARAQKALQNLKSSGYNAFQEVSDLGDKGLFYRVRIGGLANEAQAQTTLENIRKDFQGGFIVKQPK